MKCFNDLVFKDHNKYLLLPKYLKALLSYEIFFIDSLKLYLLLVIFNIIRYKLILFLLSMYILRRIIIIIKNKISFNEIIIVTSVVLFKKYYLVKYDCNKG